MIGVNTGQFMKKYAQATYSFRYDGSVYEFCLRQGDTNGI